MIVMCALVGQSFIALLFLRVCGHHVRMFASRFFRSRVLWFAAMAALAAGSYLTVPAAAQQDLLSAQVLRVIDGDTLDVRLDSGRMRVRLHGIDAPERNQPGGDAATRWLTERVGNRRVQLEPVSQDQYGRMLAIVHRDGANLNGDLVRAGHAWAYRRHLRAEDAGWCDLEAAARREGAGLWGSAMPAAPWEFRAANGRGPFRDYSRETSADCRRRMR